MMTINEAQTATLDQLTTELAAAGWDSTFTDLDGARAAVARLLTETAAIIGNAKDIGGGCFETEDGDVIVAGYGSALAPPTPDPADDTIGSGQESHYDLARQLEMRGYTVDADTEDNEHSYVRFNDVHVGDIHGDSVATVTNVV
tara:strand:- start:2072 stop:2503 length:432 start_codon:yes stop_codon:yes gene_type:complete